MVCPTQVTNHLLEHYAMKMKLMTLNLAAGLLAFPALAADSQPARPKIYDENASGPKLIAEAAAAAKPDKRVLLQFGANWCGWCHKLHNLFATDSAITNAVKSGYVVALIDVNKGHNADLIAKYGAERLGLPFLVVLDADGKHLTTKKSDELEEGDHHNPKKVLAFLQEWAPKKEQGPRIVAPKTADSPPSTTTPRAADH
jgi:thiol:disulfide interchange protein